jgi:hypothetical protein
MIPNHPDREHDTNFPDKPFKETSHLDLHTLKQNPMLLH